MAVGGRLGTWGRGALVLGHLELMVELGGRSHATPTPPASELGIQHLRSKRGHADVRGEELHTGGDPGLSPVTRGRPGAGRGLQERM